ncbi:hypothetical protein FQA47_004380 [Oryzias melastigma]|uniref:Uncharacterized protein n=1 Tax=Oryzias melastigma TaxID=30732 RepID=A0A834FIV6_ORYME|nr:hypothetical protein FQA47_004380 [Oryzias melastigma]
MTDSMEDSPVLREESASPRSGEHGVQHQDQQNDDQTVLETHPDTGSGRDARAALVSAHLRTGELPRVLPGLRQRSSDRPLLYLLPVLPPT